MAQTNQVLLSLVVRTPDGASIERGFAKNRILIGRNPESDVVLTEPAAGLDHARIEVTAEGAVRLLDLGTSSGTFVNDNRVERMTILQSGDMLRVGQVRIDVKVQRLEADLAGPGASRGPRKDDVLSRPVLHVAQYWGDSSVSIQQFGKTSRPILHSLAFAGLLLGLEGLLAWNLFFGLKRMYVNGEIPDYMPTFLGLLAVLVVANIIVLIMTGDLFKWPRSANFKNVILGHSGNVDFIVHKEHLGDQDNYVLVQPYKGAPAINLKSTLVKGKVLVDGQVLSLEDAKKTSLVKDGVFLPLNYRTRARIEIGDESFVISLDPQVKESRGQLLSRFDLASFTCFAVSFFICTMFLLTLMAFPKNEKVKKSKGLTSKTFKTLVVYEAQKKEEKKEEEKKKDPTKEEEKVEEEKKDEERLDKEIEELPSKVVSSQPAKVVQQNPLQVKVVQPTVQDKKIVNNLTDQKTRPRNVSVSSVAGPKRQQRNQDRLSLIRQQGRIVASSSFGKEALPSGLADMNDLNYNTDVGGIDPTGGYATGTDSGDGFNAWNIASSTGTNTEGNPFGGAAYGPSVGADGKTVGGQTGVKVIPGGTVIANLSSKQGTLAEVKTGGMQKKALDVALPSGVETAGSGLEQEQIKAVIRKKRNEIKSCLQLVVNKGQDVQGKIYISFMITPTGAVSNLSLSSEVNNPELEGCLQQKIPTWRFPQPKDSGTVWVKKYPLIFHKQ